MFTGPDIDQLAATVAVMDKLSFVGHQALLLTVITFRLIVLSLKDFLLLLLLFILFILSFKCLYIII